MSYVRNYIQAIENPLPELKRSFEEELNLLKKLSGPGYIVLDVGCGAGRPASALSKSVKRIYCVDNDREMLRLAKKRCSGLDNVEILERDDFDMVYSTYNLIGSVRKSERQEIINEMRRVAKKGCGVVNITWKNDAKTTEFLREYYPSIGIAILESDDSKTVTSKGGFERISEKELRGLYDSAGIREVEFSAVGPVWFAITGRK